MTLRNIFKKKYAPLIIRIDDRLIHGQVIVGWGDKLSLYRIILANDEAADDESLSDLYKSLMPPEIDGYVFSLSDAVKFLKHNPSDGRTMLVVGNPKDALTLMKSGLKTDRIIIGGLHHRNGAQKILSYLFLDDERRDELMKLMKMKIPLICQDLPGNPPFKISEQLLEG
ncbi:MAG: PTS sugar transporter subunit IIB [candidate division Zixibacteria bacterium]|nr:PTS sugar transporter subunit IIB [Candidatus Tariuqbacter arcticus]